MATDALSDLDLVAAGNRGDAAALETLYLRYRDWVYAAAWRITRHGDDAQDVVQDAFAYLFSKFPGFVLTAQLKTFLYPAIRNLALARRRQTRRYGPLDNADAVPARDAGGSGGSASDLAVVLAGLPDGEREVLLLRFVDGLSLQEIADAVGIPLGTVKSRLYSALESLRANPRTRNLLVP